MQRTRGAALLPAALCLLVATARADLNDGKPCFSYVNPPGEGVRYVCTSTSSHTFEHPEPVEVSRGWRTRITARREGEPAIYDRTFDSRAAPADDPSVQAAFDEASRLVARTTLSLRAPALRSSTTARVDGMPFAPAVPTTTVTQISDASSASTRIVCVGDLGELPEPPSRLPEGSACRASAWKLTLRAVDTSVGTPLQDLVADTHRHVQTDRYPAARLSGDLTTSHYEILATPVSPCTVRDGHADLLDCTSESRQTVEQNSTASADGGAWSTRITGRLADGSLVYDTTVNAAVDAERDDEIRTRLLAAREALASATGGGPVSGPLRLSSAISAVTATPLPNAARLSTETYGFSATGPGVVCVGNLGELGRVPPSLPVSPCPASAFALTLGYLPCWFCHWPPTAMQTAFSRHTHTQRSIHPALYVTGVLTTAHYEYVAEPATTTLTIPIVLSPTGGSAFTSELTLANFGSADAQASFAYTPAFGGTAGTVSDTLPGATQRIVPDAIAYLKSLGLTDPGVGGVLRMTFAGSAAPDVYAAVRTTASVPEGRVGLAYPALPPSKLFSSSIVLSGLRQNALDRSNVAVLNAGAPGEGDVTLRLTVSSGEPANPQSKALPDVVLSPGGFSQVSSILVSNGLSLSNGTVRVERIAGTAPFYAYAVVNDQATADGSFIEPVAANPASPIPSTTLPAVVETAAYSTELVLTNLSTSPRTLNFTWVAPALTGGKATFSIPLLPGEQQILPGFVQLLRDRGAVTDARGPSFAGALFVSDSSGDLRGVSVSARILSALGGGRAGVALPSYPSGTESTAPVWLCGLQQNGETRSNLALVIVGSTDASSSDFRIDLYDGTTGAKVASPVATVPARGFVQIDRILGAYAPGVTQGCALVSKTTGNNPFLAYAVLNDGAQPGLRSGDGAYVASIPLIP